MFQNTFTKTIHNMINRFNRINTTYIYHIYNNNTYYPDGETTVQIR